MAAMAPYKGPNIAEVKANGRKCRLILAVRNVIEKILVNMTCSAMNRLIIINFLT